MSSATDLFQAVLRIVINYMTIIVSNVLLAITHICSNYPEASRIFAILLAIYFVITSFMRIVRFWWGMLKFVVKVMLLFIVVLVATLTYFRGPHRFFTKDLPFAYKMWQSFSQKQQESIQNSFKYAMDNTGIDPNAVKRDTIEWVSDNSEQIEYIKSGVQRLAAENIGNLQNIMGNVNLQNMGFGIH